MDRPPKRLKILSLDGGGVRGLSSVLVLEAIWQRYMEFLRDANIHNEAMKPCDFFDLIGGTSTGGLIALMLGRLRMNIRDCIDAYMDLSARVFSDPQEIWHRAKFDSTNFERILQERIEFQTVPLGENRGPGGQIPGNPYAPLLDPRGFARTCKTVVFALSAANLNAPATPFRTYEHGTRVYGDATIWQAARATTAALTYFKPLKVNSTNWCDAGICYNNASEVLEREARELWGPANGPESIANDDFLLFLNIGTGLPKPNAVGGEAFSMMLRRVGAKIEAVPRVVQAVTNSENAAEALGSRLGLNIFYRFNVEQGVGDVKLFAHEELDRIRAHTNSYLSTVTVRNRITQCAQLIFDWHMLRRRMPEASISDCRDSIPRYGSIYERANKRRFGPREMATFQTLTISYLREPRQADRFWDRLTIYGLEKYESIYAQIPKEKEQYVRILAVMPFVRCRGIGPDIVQKYWKLISSTDRNEGSINDLLPRNLVLAVIFLLHLERVMGLNSYITMDRNTRISVRRFGNWTQCLCQCWPHNQQCGLEWNYCCHRDGLHRGNAQDQCIVLKRLLERETLQQENEDLYQKAEDAQNKTRNIWASGRDQDWRGPLSFVEAKGRGIL